MMGRTVMAVVAAIVVAAVSGCTAIAGAQSAQSAAGTDAQRHECERNGGYWATSSGICKIGA